MDSIHGNALLKMGLIVAPSCDDCHGVHTIKRSVDRDSPINHANVARTCGKCHVGIETTYDQSVHGQLLAKGDPRGPVCINCHSAHEIVHSRHTCPATATFVRAREAFGGEAQSTQVVKLLEDFVISPKIIGERAAGAALRFEFRDGEGPGFDGTMLTCDPPPASNVIRARRRNSPNTSRTPTRWTRRIIHCCTWCSWR